MTQYVVVVQDKHNEWDIQVYGPCSQHTAERKANELIKTHPNKTISVRPIHPV